MLPIRSLDLVDSNITQTLTGWTYFLHFPVTGRVARAFSGVFYIGSKNQQHKGRGKEANASVSLLAVAMYSFFSFTINYQYASSDLELYGGKYDNKISFHSIHRFSSFFICGSTKLHSFILTPNMKIPTLTNIPLFSIRTCAIHCVYLD